MLSDHRKPAGGNVKYSDTAITSGPVHRSVKKRHWSHCGSDFSGSVPFCEKDHCGCGSTAGSANGYATTAHDDEMATAGRVTRRRH